VLDEIVGHLRLDGAIEAISAGRHAPQLCGHGIVLFHSASFISKGVPVGATHGGYRPEIWLGLRPTVIRDAVARALGSAWFGREQLGAVIIDAT